MVPADVVGLHSVVGGLAEAVPGVRAVAVSGFERLFVYEACSEATWRESSSIRSNSLAGLSGVEGEMLAVVGRGVTSRILSARREVKSRLPVYTRNRILG